MAKKDKDHKKNKSNKKTAAMDQQPEAAQPVALQAGVAGSPENEMRRIAREAAWARMFGRNDTKNPFGG